MLKKENRLSTNFEFNIARKYGRYYAGRYFHAYFLNPKNYDGSTKFGVVVSNKFSKKAVERNRVKRVYREVIRNNLDKLDKNGLWVVIHPKFISLQKDYEEINTDFNKVLQEESIS